MKERKKLARPAFKEFDILDMYTQDNINKCENCFKGLSCNKHKFKR